MKLLLEKAEEKNYAIGSFSVSNMEMIMGAIQAAEDRNSPIILQVAQGRLKTSPLHLIGPMMIEAAKRASVPVGVHLDHGKSIDIIKQALDLGFTSVMIDASDLPIEQNIEITIKVKQMADSYGASVEAEVGQLSVSEEGVIQKGKFYSEPDEVKMLYDSTKVDAIALSIGNVHGLHKEEPRLDFDLLSRTKKLVSVPLVLHGGSGISPDDFRRCISLGIRKINIATANFMSIDGAAREYCLDDQRDYFLLSNKMTSSMCSNVMKHIDIFQSNQKAWGEA